jgi:dihydrofolate synthase/folylpolyglutamate synthase
VSRLRPHVDWLRENDPENAPTFFDATTAAALLIFAEADLDCAILEVGLGGRLDSTNIVTPRVSCITSIELEHTDKLGHTLAEIAAEKAGIIKSRVPCVIGRLAPDAECVIRDRAQELGAPVLQLGKDFPPLDPDELTVLGRHQADNAAIALRAIDLLGVLDRDEFMIAARKGIAATRLPGRMEVLSDDPWILVDGAHTRASALALAETLAERSFDRTILLLSISGGKDLDGILDALLPRVDEVVVTRAEPNRSLPAEALASAIRTADPTIPIRLIPNPDQAAKQALRSTAPGQALIAAGSIYLAATARTHWQNDHQPAQATSPNQAPRPRSITS